MSNPEASRIEIVRANDPLVAEDMHHPAFIVNVNLFPLKYFTDVRKLYTNFYKANYFQLNRDLFNINWLGELNDLDTDSAVNKFYELLVPFIESIPKTIVSSRDYPVYYSRELISLIKRKAYVKLKIKIAQTSNPSKSVVEKPT